MKDLFTPGSEFELRIRVLKDDVPGDVRVRQMLKQMLRRLGLRCLSIRPRRKK